MTPLGQADGTTAPQMVVRMRHQWGIKCLIALTCHWAMVLHLLLHLMTLLVMYLACILGKL